MTLSGAPPGDGLLDAPRFAGDPVGYLCDLHRTYGRLVALRAGPRPMIFAFGPEYNQPLLTRTETFHSNLFTLPGPKDSPLRRVGLGLITMNGDAHKRHRRLVMPSFQKKAIEGFADAVSGAVDQMLDTWEPGQIRDLCADMKRLSLHVSSRVIFGLDDLDGAVRVGGTIDEMLDLSMEMGLSGLVPVAGSAAIYERLLKTAAQSEASALDLVARKRVEDANGRDVLSLFIRARDGDGPALGDAELAAQATVLFGAASRTTASALIWTLFLLAQHPTVMQEVHEELDEILGGRAPGPEDLGRLTQLDRVLKESMRLLPPVVFNTRTAASDTELGPLRVSRGTTAVFSHYVTHHLPDIYPEPERFLPERWRLLTPSPYAYLPFSAGPRMCIGAGMAMLVIKTSLAIMLQRYRLWVVPGQRIDRTVSVPLLPKDRMRVVAFRQDGRFSRSEVQGNIHEMVTLDREWSPGIRRAA